MSIGPGDFVFDDGPLSHFAEAGWLGLVELIVGDAQAVMPDVVADELRLGASSYPHLVGVLAAPWLSEYSLRSSLELGAFAGYAERLVGKDGSRNVGECGVLSLCKVTGAHAVVDDAAARAIAEDDGISVVTSVEMICRAIREHSLSLEAGSAVADSLLVTEFRLPFGPGEFRSFVLENGLVPYE